jgi:3-oxoacyl-[acyl-carrier protein] reductase
VSRSTQRPEAEPQTSRSARRFRASHRALELRRPGRINTAQILDRLHLDEASRRAFIDRDIPAGRFGGPEEAAALIVFLASDAARYVNGTTIPVDGGALRYAF